MPTLFDLTGKVAIVTGSTKGIGLAIATRMAEHGATVVISSRKANVCETVAASIQAAMADPKWARLRCTRARSDQACARPLSSPTSSNVAIAAGAVSSASAVHPCGLVHIPIGRRQFGRESVPVPIRIFAPREQRASKVGGEI